MRRKTALSLIFGFSLHASSAWALPVSIPESSDGIFLVNALQRVVSFVKSAPGQLLFAKDFSVESFVAKADQVTFEFTFESLIDKQGEKRCLMNYDDSTVIRVHESPQCLTSLREDASALHITLLHEVLNLLGLEKPKWGTGSVYEISRKLLGVDLARLEVAQEFVLHSTCEIYSGDLELLSQEKLPLMQEEFLRSKGYTYLGNWRFSAYLPSVGAFFGSAEDPPTRRPLVLQFEYFKRNRNSWSPFEVAVLSIERLFHPTGYVGSIGRKDWRRQGHAWKKVRLKATEVSPERSWRVLFRTTARAKIKYLRPPLFGGRDTQDSGSWAISSLEHPLTHTLPSIPDCVKIPSLR